MDDQDNKLKTLNLESIIKDIQKALDPVIEQEDSDVLAQNALVGYKGFRVGGFHIHVKMNGDEKISLSHLLSKDRLVPQDIVVDYGFGHDYVYSINPLSAISWLVSKHGSPSKAIKELEALANERPN
jgi:hypothetical protein